MVPASLAQAQIQTRADAESDAESGADVGDPAASDPGLALERRVEDYLETYLATFPSRATAAGDPRFDAWLEDLSPAMLDAWLDTNLETAKALEALLEAPNLDERRRLDAEAVLAHARLEIFEHRELDRWSRDPLLWTQLLSRVAVMLLVRDNSPLDVRLRHLAARVSQVPRLCRQAQAALEDTPDAELDAETLGMAAGLARASARFYRDGLPRTADPVAPPKGPQLTRRLESAGARAAEALEELATFFAKRATTASGDALKGALYAEHFKLSTGALESVDEVLARTERDFEALRHEAAEHCRGLWPQVRPGTTPPEGVDPVLAACFARLGEDRPESTEDFIASFRRLTLEARRFVVDHDLVAMPPGLRVVVDRSPSYFAGQAVGGVYSAGPFEPEAPTLLFVPTPRDGAPPEMTEVFYRDFNDHFTVMITPHETIPGHALQAAVAARQPWPARILFSNGVYVEGWGTFSERLMIEQGWGGDLAKAAHLKKQLENAARLIVDVKVHRGEMDRDDVVSFVRHRAHQNAQFAANMWIRALTSSPQITTYHLGYRQIRDLYDEVRRRRGESFDLRAFNDAMLSLGPVPVSHYRRLLLQEP